MVFSSLGALRHTLGVVGASGKREIEDDFSSRSFELTADAMCCCTMVLRVVEVSFSPFSNAFTEFSLSSSKCKNESEESDESLSMGIAVMVTLRLCTLRMGCEMSSHVAVSAVSHLWLKHSLTLGRLLKRYETS